MLTLPLSAEAPLIRPVNEIHPQRSIGWRRKAD